jgi:hypothetical protein
MTSQSMLNSVEASEDAARAFSPKMRPTNMESVIGIRKDRKKVSDSDGYLRGWFLREKKRENCEVNGVNWSEFFEASSGDVLSIHNHHPFGFLSIFAQFVKDNGYPKTQL